MNKKKKYSYQAQPPEPMRFCTITRKIFLKYGRQKDASRLIMFMILARTI